MKNNLFDENDLKEVLVQLNNDNDEKIFEIEESDEMKAAKKRYEDYLLKHKE